MKNLIKEMENSRKPSKRTEIKKIKRKWLRNILSLMHACSFE